MLLNNSDVDSASYTIEGWKILHIYRVKHPVHNYLYNPAIMMDSDGDEWIGLQRYTMSETLGWKNKDTDVALTGLDFTWSGSYEHLPHMF